MWTVGFGLTLVPNGFEPSNANSPSESTTSLLSGSEPALRAEFRALPLVSGEPAESAESFCQNMNPARMSMAAANTEHAMMARFMVVSESGMLTFRWFGGTFVVGRSTK